MKKFFITVLAIITVLVAFLVFHALDFYFPGNLISKIFRGLSVVITPVLIALVIMYLINPLSQMFIRKYKVNKKVAIGFSMAIFFLAIIALLAFTSVFVIEQGKLLYDQITDPDFMLAVENWFIRNNIQFIYTGIIDFLTNFDFTQLFSSAGSIVTTVFQGLASVILAPIFLWHFMNSQEVVLDKVNDNIPAKWRNRFIPLLKDSNNVIETYFKSKLLSIVILFFLFMILYSVLGFSVGYALLFAVLISFLDLIPYLGPSVGSIVPVIYLFSVGGTNILYNSNWHVSALAASIIMLGINVAIQYLQGNIIMPQLVGKEMEINSALILVFMLFFGYVLGFWGIILAIPLGGIMLVIWKHKIGRASCRERV